MSYSMLENILFCESIFRQVFKSKQSLPEAASFDWGKVWTHDLPGVAQTIVSKPSPQNIEKWGWRESFYLKSTGWVVNRRTRDTKCPLKKQEKSQRSLTHK